MERSLDTDSDTTYLFFDYGSAGWLVIQMPVSG